MKNCFLKLHKRILFLLCVTLLLTGCNKASENSGGNTEDAGNSQMIVADTESMKNAKETQISEIAEEVNLSDIAEDVETSEPEESTEDTEPASIMEIPPEVAIPEESPILNASTVGENVGVTYGIDVSLYQGTIDWATVAANGIDFAIIRIGYRGTTAGGFGEDPMAKYNLQEAEKNGVKIGIYFYSTAISEEEAREEADWICDYIADYSVTYPIAIDCEGYEREGHRQYPLTQEERTDVAMAFMDRIYENGYTPMIYGDVKSFENDAEWDTSRIEEKYKIWIAWYNQDISNLENKPDYKGEFAMWQYSNHGHVNGIPAEVDLDVAYFGYDGIEEPKNTSIRETE